MVGELLSPGRTVVESSAGQLQAKALYARNLTTLATRLVVF